MNDQDAELANYSGLAVGLCTYKRLSSLMRLLDHIAISAGELEEKPVIIIADNDGSDPEVGASVNTFSERSGITVRYLIETHPGISAARNAVFTEAERLNVRFVAMIDDDEWPSKVWLEELLKTQAQEQVAVVGGPVRPEFPNNAKHLEKFARYWSVQKQFLHGKPFVFCSCNFLIDMQAISDVSRPLFDEAFGLSGGGDTVFFRGLFMAGKSMGWTEDAFVYEEVPESRASIKWMRQRRFRVGNHAARWESMGGNARKSFLKTLGLTVRLPIYPLFMREPESPMLGWLLELDKVRGRYNFHFGEVFIEYGREKPKDDGRTCR